MPAGRAVDQRVGLASWPGRTDLSHAPTVSQLGDSSHQPKGGIRHIVEEALSYPRAIYLSIPQITVFSASSSSRSISN